jgi:hypothetical protein
MFQGGRMSRLRRQGHTANQWMLLGRCTGSPRSVVGQEEVEFALKLLPDSRKIHGIRTVQLRELRKFQR